MALLKTISSGLKPSPSAKATISSPTAKKPVDIGSLKKPQSPSALKTKPIPAPMKSPVKAEKPPVDGEKSSKVEKPLKLVITKPSVGSTIKTPTSVVKNPAMKSPTAETKTLGRSVMKSAPKTPEPKLSSSKTEMIVRSAPEKLAGGRTNANSASGLKISPTSSVKSLSSAVKSVSSPLKSAVSSSIKSISSPVKSISSPVKSPSTAKLVSSPAKSISSPVKSVSSPIKSVSPVKSVSSPVKSGSPAKSISSPIKSKLASVEIPKDTKTKAATGVIKKPASSIKSPIKTMTSPSATKLKLSPTKASKADSPSTKIVSKPSTAETVIVDETTTAIVETPDPSHCTDPTEKFEEVSNTALITKYPVDNKNFDVAQAFKVAEQLIKIQSNDRNLESTIQTYENTSSINWDDVITPCDNFASNSNLEIINSAVSTCAPQELILKHDSCIIEMTDLKIHLDSSDSSIADSQDKLSSKRDDENQNIFEITESSSCSDSGSIQNDDKYFSDEVSSTSVCSESVETKLNDFVNEIVPECADLIRTGEENVLPEWTITIDEFSLVDLGSKDSQSLIVAEKENLLVEKTSCSVSMSYADVLKKIPNVLVNSTNVQCHKKEPKLNVNLEIKQYQMLKKVEGLYSTTMFFNNIENNYQNCDDNYYFEEPEYCEMRKKKCKKIKHLSKRHLRNINREPEYIENHPDVYVTSVWKNIY